MTVRTLPPIPYLPPLPTRSAIYQRSLDELVEHYELLAKKHQKAFIANGECARLPQELTDVGHTSRWQPGARVVDLSYLNPGTVIANFKVVQGRAIFPNESGYHAALFDQFQYGAIMSNGLPCVFTMVDQWRGKNLGRRGVGIPSLEWRKAYPVYDEPANRADEFYVVMVP